MSQLDPQILSCCLCLDLLKDPVATSCGHNYCRKCLQQHWDTEEKNRRDYSCPQCRRTFTPRPDLEKNTVLADLVETLHLQPHCDVRRIRRKKLERPSQQLQENICPRHGEVMKIFCRTDQRMICYLCTMDDHKGHDTVAAAAEMTERQRELEETRQEIQQKIQHTEEDLKVLQREVKSINSSADKTVKDSDDIFTQMIRQLEKRRSEVQQQVRSTQGAEVSRVTELQKKLKQEMIELKRRDTELEDISHTLDHSQFLHSFFSLPALSPSPDSSSLEIRPLRYFEDVAAAVTKLRDKMQQVLVETQTSTSWTVRNVLISFLVLCFCVILLSLLGSLLLGSGSEPRSREDFLRYSCQITLDPNTVNNYLLLSEENRRVRGMEEVQPYRDHPDRFTDWPQVLSTEGLTGRCYWEVEWSGEVVGVAVAYRNISRTGSESGFGFNDKSWSLYCFSDVYQFYHNNISSDVSGSFRVGVYLDHTAGLLSFYSVSGTMELLHRVQTSFTQPLHVGLFVFSGSLAELMKV